MRTISISGSRTAAKKAPAPMPTVDVNRDIWRDHKLLVGPVKIGRTWWMYAVYHEPYDCCNYTDMYWFEPSEFVAGGGRWKKSAEHPRYSFSGVNSGLPKGLYTDLYAPNKDLINEALGSKSFHAGHSARGMCRSVDDCDSSRYDLGEWVKGWNAADQSPAYRNFPVKRTA